MYIIQAGGEWLLYGRAITLRLTYVRINYGGVFPRIVSSGLGKYHT